MVIASSRSKPLSYGRTPLKFTVYSTNSEGNKFCCKPGSDSNSAFEAVMAALYFVHFLQRRSMDMKTLTVQRDGAVLTATIMAPPMNLLGPELVHDLVSFISEAEADEAIRVIVFK